MGDFDCGAYVPLGDRYIATWISTPICAYPSTDRNLVLKQVWRLRGPFEPLHTASCCSSNQPFRETENVLLKHRAEAQF